MNNAIDSRISGIRTVFSLGLEPLSPLWSCLQRSLSPFTFIGGRIRLFIHNEALRIIKKGCSERKKEIARLNSLWQISHRSLEKHEKKVREIRIQSITRSQALLKYDGFRRTIFILFSRNWIRVCGRSLRQRLQWLREGRKELSLRNSKRPLPPPSTTSTRFRYWMQF